MSLYELRRILCSRLYARLAALLLVPAVCLMIIGWADNWDKIRTESQNINSVKAEFIQEKHLKILANPLISKGLFAFKPPDSLRWEYAEPIKSVLLVHQGKVKRYIEVDGHLQEDAAAGLEAMQIVIREITRWLNGRFNENPDFEADIDSHGKITLVPVSKSLSAMIGRIEIQLAETPGVIQYVQIYENENSYTLLKFNQPELNIDLEDSVFFRP